MTDPDRFGRVKALLVFGNDAAPKSVVTTLIAERQEGPSGRVNVRGHVRFSPVTMEHIRSVVHPVVVGVCRELCVEAGSFVLQGVNIGAASAVDVGVEVSGFSADLPVAIAMLSARLRLTVPDDVAVTGHLASRHGEIRVVRNLAAKLAAAADDESVNAVVCPSLLGDLSFRDLAGSEYRDVEQVMEEHRSRISIRPAAHFAEAVSHIFDERAMVHGALAGGYLGRRFPYRENTTVIHATARVLGSHTRKRFFTLAESILAAGDIVAARELMQAWVAHHVRRRTYPHGFARRVHGMIRSTPPAIRSAMRPGLLSVESCIALSQFATERDRGDVFELYDTVARVGHYWGERGTDAPKRRQRDAERSSTLQIVASEIDPDHLTEMIGIPIDAARGSYGLDSPVVRSHGELLDVVSSFYLHVLRHTDRLRGETAPDAVAADALALLEKAFAREGGVAAARAEATVGAQGGMRTILDRMTEQYKRERQEDYVRHVLATAIDPLDWPAKVAFMKDFVAVHPDAIPAELAGEPAERFAGSYEAIVRTLVRSMAEVKQVFRAL